jgi:hypothetical protein
MSLSARALDDNNEYQRVAGIQCPNIAGKKVIRPKK